MRFTVNTKPLKSVTDLGIIRANITKHDHRSHIVQLTASKDTLTINVEATSIKTRMTLRGSGDSDTTSIIIVDCAKFKALLDSIETSVITLEFANGGLYIYAGSSKFAIPQMFDARDAKLNEPTDQDAAAEVTTLKPANWQFIKEHQLYAIATNEERPVYRNVWVGKDHDVIVGNMDIGMFAFSKKGDLDSTCLLPTSLINLFANIPEGSTISKLGRNYVLHIDTDSYSLITEFVPKYEDDESVGSYNADIILSKAVHPTEFITVSVAPLIKFIGQTSIFRDSDQDKALNFEVKGNKLIISNKSNRYNAEVNAVTAYELLFNMDLFKKVISNFDSDMIHIAPIYGDNNTPVGCQFWTDDLTAVLSGATL